MATVDLVRPSSRCRVEYYAKTASTAYAEGSMVAPNADASNQEFVAVTATAPIILGVIQTPVASTDSDYASATKEPILIDEDGIWEFTATGTADVNDEQGYIDVDDTNPATEVDVTASTEDHVFVTQFVNATTVRGRIATWPTTVVPVQN